jgi:hypothetical protein
MGESGRQRKFLGSPRGYFAAVKEEVPEHFQFDTIEDAKGRIPRGNIYCRPLLRPSTIKRNIDLPVAWLDQCHSPIAICASISPDQRIQ